MDAFAVDLNSSRLFQEWCLNEIEEGSTPSQLVAALGEVGSIPATLRALDMAYRYTLPDYEQLSRRCLTSGDPLAAEIAKGYAVFKRSVGIARQGGPHMRVRLAEMQGALAWAQRTLAALPQSDLALEGQVGTLIPLCLLLLEACKYDEAIQAASQGCFWQSSSRPRSPSRGRGRC